MRLLGHQHLLLLEEQGLAVGLKDQPLGKAGKSSLVPARSPPPTMGHPQSLGKHTATNHLGAGDKPPAASNHRVICIIYLNTYIYAFTNFHSSVCSFFFSFFLFVDSIAEVSFCKMRSMYKTTQRIGEK